MYWAMEDNTMEFNEKTLEEWLPYWKEYVSNYRLPDWESIPDFGLYMEQVVTYIRDKIGYAKVGPDGAEIITASAINNYVRKKLMPAPVKKRYYRVHIAYLLILCILKQSLNISEICKLFPNEVADEDLRVFYTAFSDQHAKAADYFIRRLEDDGNRVLHSDLSETPYDRMSRFILDMAILSSFAKLISEKLIEYNSTDKES